MKKGQYVIQNKKGEVVRVLNWPTTQLHIVYIHDTRRVETIADLKELDRAEINYTLIDSVKKSDINKSPAQIGKVGTLRFVEDIKVVPKAIEHSEDDVMPLIFSMKWVGGISSALLVLILIIGYFFKPQPEEVRVVQIVERPQQEEIKREKIQKPVVQKQQPQKMKVVKAMEHKKSVPHLARTETPRKAQKVTTKEMSLNQVGALGVLGSLNKSNQRGGLNLDNVKSSPGVGRGGSEGSGGMQTSLYAKGLISAPLGEGQRANGAGGYGTHGKGGGQAGYGTMSLVGSAGSFFQPVRSEALVEGGLTKEEVDAVIQRHIGEIRYCYEQGLQQTPRMSGRVSMKILIGADGYATNGTRITNSSLHSPEVESCITGHLKTWKFPNPRGGVVVKVNYPIVLRRVSDS